MGTKDKLIKRFKNQPNDFTFDELTRLFTILGFNVNQKGKTSGSRIEFINTEKELTFGAHKPHPEKTIKNYVMKQVLDFLTINELI